MRGHCEGVPIQTLPSTGNLLWPGWVIRWKCHKVLCRIDSKRCSQD
ncbi:unnamed protein product [Ectocarpus sp. CCAP 1310/34]|nr:unnamed protein product [Ectocarpus sp. CCAP 1310/34]